MLVRALAGQLPKPVFPQVNAYPLILLGVGDQEHHRGFAGGLAIYAGRARCASGAGRQAVERDFEAQRVAGRDLPTKTGPVDATEKCELAGERCGGSHSQARSLRECLDHEHSGQRRPTRKMPREEILVIEMPQTDAALTRHQHDDLVHQQERRTVRQQFVGTG